MSNARNLARLLPNASGQLPDAAMSSGSVLQVVSAVKSDTFAGSIGAQWADITGLSATITPISNTSNILVIVDVKGAAGASYSVIRTRLLRNSSPIYTGNSFSAHPLGLSQFYCGADTANDVFGMAQLGGSCIDSPATTNAVTYKVQLGCDDNAKVVFINRTQADRDTNYYDARVASSITLMEIAA